MANGPAVAESEIWGTMYLRKYFKMLEYSFAILLLETLGKLFNFCASVSSFVEQGGAVKFKWDTQKASFRTVPGTEEGLNKYY